VDRLKWAISRRKKLQSFFIFRCFDIARATTIKGALGDIQKSINFTRIRLPDDAMDRFTG